MMNYEKYEADRKAACAALEELKAAVSERIAPLISSVYDILFKPFEFIAAIVRRDKAYFGIKSPSAEFARNFAGFGYGLTIGMQQAKLEQIERVFAPYEIQREIHAPEYKPLADVVRAFNYSKYLYEYYND
jgi:hypothetical protein